MKVWPSQREVLDERLTGPGHLDLVVVLEGLVEGREDHGEAVVALRGLVP